MSSIQCAHCSYRSGPRSMISHAKSHWYSKVQSTYISNGTKSVVPTRIATQADQYGFMFPDRYTPCAPIAHIPTHMIIPPRISNSPISPYQSPISTISTPTSINIICNNSPLSNCSPMNICPKSSSSSELFSCTTYNPTPYLPSSLQTLPYQPVPSNTLPLNSPITQQIFPGSIQCVHCDSNVTSLHDYADHLHVHSIERPGLIPHYMSFFHIRRSKPYWSSRARDFRAAVLLMRPLHPVAIQQSSG